jgi:hypothetical protein
MSPKVQKKPSRITRKDKVGAPERPDKNPVLNRDLK